MSSSKNVTIPLTSLHKGFTNQKGENNCFLNAALQALWHLGPFRLQLQNLASNPPTEGKILPSLYSLFRDYEFAELSVLPPNELRELLHAISDKFELGAIADANEALDAILHQLHLDHRAPPAPTEAEKEGEKEGEKKEVEKEGEKEGEKKDLENAEKKDLEKKEGDKCGCCKSLSSWRPSPASGAELSRAWSGSECVAHAVFGAAMMEQTLCAQCRRASEPQYADFFIHNTYVEEILAISKRDNFARVAPDRVFSVILKKCFQGQPKTCPGNDERQAKSLPLCAGVGHSTLSCLEAPQGFAISLTWTRDRDNQASIADLLSLVAYTVALRDVFPLVGPAAGAQDECEYVFRGLVCYYGKHYVSIFQEYSPGEPQFLLFDDGNIRNLGTWSQVKLECIRAAYQPVLLLYEAEYDSPEPNNNNNDNRNNSNADIISADVRLSSPQIIVSDKNKNPQNLQKVQNQTNQANQANQNIPDNLGQKKKASTFKIFPSNLTRVLSKFYSALYGESDAKLRNDLKFPNATLVKSNANSNSNSNPNTNNELKALELLALNGNSVSRNSVSRNSVSRIRSSTSNSNSELNSGHVFVVELTPAVYNGKNLLGLGFEQSGSKIVVSKFSKHPETNSLLPAEKSQQIQLHDQVVSINNHTLTNEQNAWNILVDILTKNPIGKKFKFCFNREILSEPFVPSPIKEKSAQSYVQQPSPLSLNNSNHLNNSNKLKSSVGSRSEGNGENMFDQFGEGDDGEDVTMVIDPKSKRLVNKIKNTFSSVTASVIPKSSAPKANANGLATVSGFEVSPVVYSVELELLGASGGHYGIIFQANIDQNLIVVDFAKKPDGQNVLPQEKCNKINMLDQLLQVGNHQVPAGDAAGAWKFLADIFKLNSPTLLMTFQSATYSQTILSSCGNRNENVKLKCIYCEKESISTSGIPSLQG